MVLLRVFSLLLLAPFFVVADSTLDKRADAVCSSSCILALQQEEAKFATTFKRLNNAVVTLQAQKPATSLGLTDPTTCGYSVKKKRSTGGITVDNEGIPRDEDGVIDQEALYELVLQKNTKRSNIEKRQSSTVTFLGEIVIFPYNFCPQGFLSTDGQILPIQQNVGLFSLLGINYGGDGKTTFALPNLQNFRPDCMITCISTSGIYPQRS